MMIKSLDRNYPHEAALVGLHEGVKESELAKLQLESTRRKIKWVNIAVFFNRMAWGDEPMRSCGHSLGYRLMCRLMSGPVYWLDVFKPYRYVIRMDDDSAFFKVVKNEIRLDQNATYGYTLEDWDRSTCQNGFINKLRHFTYNKHTAINGSGMPLSFVPSAFGKFGFSRPWKRREAESDMLGPAVYNSNFEIVDLNIFRSEHYRVYWEFIESSNLFFLTRLGDHEVKTVYLNLYEKENNIICFKDLPYSHGRLTQQRTNCGKFNRLKYVQRKITN